MRLRLLIVMVAAIMICVSAAPAAAAEMVVIVNKDNGNTFTKSMVEKIYKGDMTAWPAGGVVVAYDLPEGSAGRTDFTKSLLGISVSSLKAAWAMKLFSGKATPPKTAGSDGEMKSAVAANRNAIGYISASSLDESVKSVLTLR